MSNGVDRSKRSLFIIAAVGGLLFVALLAVMIMFILKCNSLNQDNNELRVKNEQSERENNELKFQNEQLALEIKKMQDESEEIKGEYIRFDEYSATKYVFLENSKIKRIDVVLGSREGSYNLVGNSELHIIWDGEATGWKGFSDSFAHAVSNLFGIESGVKTETLLFRHEGKNLIIEDRVFRKVQ